MTIEQQINTDALAALERINLRRIELMIEERQHTLEGIATGQDRRHIWSDVLDAAERDNIETDRDLLSGFEFPNADKPTDWLEDYHVYSHGYPTDECPQCDPAELVTHRHTDAPGEDDNV